MARSSKKIKPMTYGEMCDLYEKYYNKTISDVVGQGKGFIIKDLATTMRRKHIAAIQTIAPYHLHDEFADVSVELIAFDYNFRTHSGVACFHITGVNHLTDTTVDRVQFWNSYSSEQPETMFNVLDDILDRIEEITRQTYCDFEHEIEDKKSKK